MTDLRIPPNIDWKKELDYLGIDYKTAPVFQDHLKSIKETGNPLETDLWILEHMEKDGIIKKVKDRYIICKEAA